MPTLTPDQKAGIDKILHSLEKYGVGDIIKSMNEDMLIGTFILSVCFIEAMIQYRYFKIPPDKWVKGDSEKNWIEFVDDYFPAEYKNMGQSLYSSLRNKIVHNYSGNRIYALGDHRDEVKVKHLEFIPDGRQLLSINKFVPDVEFAFNKYKGELLTDYDTQILALAHLIKYPIFTETIF